MGLSEIIFFGVIALAVVVIVALRYLSPRAQAATPGAEAIEGALAVALVKEGAQVVLVGQALPVAERLRAPLSGRECLAWSVTVEEYFLTDSAQLEAELHLGRGGGQAPRRQGTWRRILQDQQTVDFEVNDGTGRALVRPGYPELTLVGDSGWQAWPLGEVPAEVEAFLKARGQRATSAYGENRRLRTREGVLEPGERVLVAGVARRELDPEAAQHTGYREAATRLVIEKPPDATMVVSDDLEAIRRHGLRRF